MKSVLITILSIVFTLNIIDAKPYEPQAKGSFKICTVYENRTKTGKFDSKLRQKSYIQKFDNNGNAIEIESFYQGKSEGIIKIENKYNGDGLLISKKQFDPSGKYFALMTYGYDNNKNLIADTSFSMQNEIQQKSIYKYDHNNFLIVEIHEFKVENDWIQSPTFYKNDKFGNKIEESSKHSSESTIEVSIEADLSSGNSQSSINTQENEVNLEKVSYEYKYNDNNQVIWSLRNGIGGTKIIYSFKYDKQGNIIEEISYDEIDINKPLLKREYEYK